MNLIRQMTLRIEEAPTGYAPDDMAFDGYTPEQVAYHAHLMLDAGLARGIDITHLGSTSPMVQLTSLSWKGHEFAEAARDDTRWRRTVRFIQDKGAPMTLPILSGVLRYFAKEQLGLNLP
jgi:uncharacterized protein DUF2513